MANYNKSFNFRNGVQVDDDNFIVNANGLVGIGTSIPREFLDVHGTAKITGLVTATNLTITGVSTFYSDVKIGSGITFNASTGIISATAFYGDGGNLLNVEQVAVDGWIVNAGNISTTSKVGIGTTLPYHSLQVGQDPLTGNGFSVDAITGNVNTTGIITSPSFFGILTGSVIGDINSTGISTFTTLKVGTGVTITDGIVSSNSFIGNVSGDINSIGISTFITLKVGTGVTISGGIITATTFSGPLIGNLTGNVTGIASTALTLPSSARISITSINSGFTSTGIATVTDTLYVTGFPAKIGVGTISAPEADIEVNKSGDTSIRVISGNGIASIGIGRSAEVRTGNTNTFYSYSTRNSLDIINSNAGNVNYYLDYGSAGLGTGGFHWIYGQNPSSPLMSLTYNGNLGIGITDPPSKLYVVGTSYITGITTIDNDLRVNNDLYTTGNITFNGSLIGNLGITTLSRLGISTSTISGNSYEFFVGGDPVFGEGVSITKSSIRASGNIRSTTITSTNINNTGIITSTLGFVGTLTGNVTGTATTAFEAFNLTGTPSIKPTSVGIGTTNIEDEDTTLYVVGNSEFYGDVSVSGTLTANNVNSLTLATAQNVSGLGTSVNFTDIPSWVKRITVIFDGVSTNGTSIPLIQLGDSGGIETTGYTSKCTAVSLVLNNNTRQGSSTDGVRLGSDVHTAAAILTGNISINNISGDTWIATGIFTSANVSGDSVNTTTAQKTLSATLDTVRITTVNGTDTFDDGTINIMYE